METTVATAEEKAAFRAERRERKLRKRKQQDMVVRGRSVKTVLVPAIARRAKEKRK